MSNTTVKLKHVSVHRSEARALNPANGVKEGLKFETQLMQNPDYFDLHLKLATLGKTTLDYNYSVYKYFNIYICVYGRFDITEATGRQVVNFQETEVLNHLLPVVKEVFTKNLEMLKMGTSFELPDTFNKVVHQKMIKRNEQYALNVGEDVS